MKQFYLLIVLFIATSCIPISVKPSIDDYKITNAKKFKKGLPNKTAFIFEDPKNTDEFYTYINVKFNANNAYVESNIPIKIGDQIYFMTFYEVERATKTVNILPMAVDAILEHKDVTDGASLESAYTSRSGSWYISIIVQDNDFNDVLKDDTKVRQQTVAFLKSLKQEYLTTANYQEIYFKNPPTQ